MLLFLMCAFLFVSGSELIAEQTQTDPTCATKTTPRTFVFVTKTPPEYKKVVSDVLLARNFRHDQPLGPDKYHARYEQDVIWGQCSWLTDFWFLRTLKDDQRCSNLPMIQMVVWKTNIQWHIHNNRIKHQSLDFSFWPAGYNLEHEEEFQLLQRVYEAHEALPEPRDPLVYIVKNPFKNAGSGIHLISSLAQLQALNQKGNPMFPISQTKPLAQRYVTNPLLVAGHKTTFRVWVLITSFDPITVYRYENGPVKFGGHKYKMDNFDNHEIHVASWSGKSKEAGSTEELEKKLNLVGGRTDLDTILPILENEMGFNMTHVNQEIDRAILGIIFSAQPHIHSHFMRLLVNGRKNRLRHYEMVGFDILLDDTGKPYVLEVNLLPDLRSDTPILTTAVRRMLHGMFDIVDLEDKHIAEVRAQTDAKWDGVFTRVPVYESLKLNFSLQDIMNRDEMFTFVNDEAELARAEGTGWRRLCPARSPIAEMWQPLTNNPRDALFQKWYNLNMTVARIPKKEDIPGLLQFKKDPHGQPVDYIN